MYILYNNYTCVFLLSAFHFKKTTYTQKKNIWHLIFHHLSEQTWYWMCLCFLLHLTVSNKKGNVITDQCNLPGTIMRLWSAINLVWVIPTLGWSIAKQLAAATGFCDRLCGLLHLVKTMNTKNVTHRKNKYELTKEKKSFDHVYGRYFKPNYCKFSTYFYITYTFICVEETYYILRSGKQLFSACFWLCCGQKHYEKSCWLSLFFSTF